MSLKKYLPMFIINMAFIASEIFCVEFSSTPSHPKLANNGSNVSLVWQYASNTSSTFTRIFRTNLENTPLKTILLFVTGSSGPIIGDPRVAFLPPAGVLISSLTVEDEGWIGCLVDFADLSTVYNKVYLQITSPPQVISIPVSNVVREGNNLAIPCQAKGRPEPVISWFRRIGLNFYQLLPGSSYSMTVATLGNSDGLVMTQSTLTIIDVHKSEAGAYKCVAENIAGNFAGFTTVAVQFPPTNTVLTMDSSYVLEGDSNSMTCSTTADPPATFEFYFGSTLLSSQANQSYVFKEVFNYDEGLYTCKPKNELGYGTEASATLIVNVKPKLLSFTTSPASTNAGISTTVSCRFLADPDPTVLWTKNGFRIATNNYVNLRVSNATLTTVTTHLPISNPQLEDAGTYTCLAQNSNGTAGAHISLVVYLSPNITVATFAQPAVEVSEASTVTYSCTARAFPSANIIWYLGTNQIVSDSTYLVSPLTEVASGLNFFDMSRSVTVRSIPRSSAGLLKCEASNSYGMDQESTKLVVRYSPLFTAFPEATNAVASGGNKAVTCTVHSMEKAEIRWYRNDVLVDSLSRHSTSVAVDAASSTDYVVLLASTMLVNPITISDNNATYRCTATNSMGNSSRLTTFYVLYAPVILAYPLAEIQTAESTPNFPIVCRVQGNPSPVISWFKDGLILAFPSSDFTVNTELISTASTGTVLESVLSINRASKMAHSGVYKCRAANSQGAVENSTTLSITYIPVYVIMEEAKTLGDVNNSVTLRCRVSAFPKPAVWWWKPANIVEGGRFSFVNRTVEDSAQYGVVEANLTISMISVSDYGIYFCRTSNGMTSAERNTTLIVNYPPRSQAYSEQILTANIDTILLSHEAISYPGADFAFRFNGSSVNASVYTTSVVTNKLGENVVNKTGVIATSGKVKVGMGGDYEIQACNRLQCQTKSIRVIVLYPPMTYKRALENVVTVNSSQSVTFTCSVQSNPVSSLSWFKNDILLIPADGLSVSNNQIQNGVFDSMVASTLTISNVSLTHRGVYKCIANNSLAALVQNSSLIVWYKPIPTLSLPDAMTLSEGSSIYLAYATSSNPASIYKWTKDGGSIPAEFTASSTLFDNTTVFDVYQKGERTLSQAVGSASGNYSISVCNMLGCVQDDVIITVIYPPVWIFMASFIYEPENKTTNITCKARAQPAPTVVWSKDGLALPEGKHLVNQRSDVKLYETEVTSVLTISSLARSDAGVFTCTASNSLGRTENSTKLVVYFSPIQNSSPSSLMTLIEGVDSLKVVYDVTSYDGKTSFIWTYNGNLVSTSIYALSQSLISQNEFESRVQGILSVNPVQRSMAGLYQVTAVHDMGNRTAQVQVIVNSPPKFSQSATCARQSIANVSIMNCTCSGVGYPTPVTYWTKDGDSAVLSNSTELILVVQEGIDGAYICHLDNIVNNLTSEAHIAIFGSTYTLWTPWGPCDAALCTGGFSTRTRACNIPPCQQELEQKRNCTGTCLPSAQPSIADKKEDDWYIALYVLAPLAIVLLILGAMWLARLQRRRPDNMLVVPINEELSAPPTTAPIGVMNGNVYSNFRPRDMETIEVQMLFEKEPVTESETDIVDGVQMSPEEHYESLGRRNRQVTFNNNSNPNGWENFGYDDY